MRTRYLASEIQRLVRLWLMACAIWALAPAIPAAAQATGDGDKPERGVTTIGPAVPLSDAQRVALAAKRAATIIPVAPVEMAAMKPAPISTRLDRAGSDVPQTGLKDKSPIALAPGAAAQARLRELEREDAAIDAFIAALGPELARRIGLVKTGVHGPAMRTAPAPRPAAGGAR